MNLLYVYADSPREFNCSAHNVIRPVNVINKMFPEKHQAIAIYCGHFAKNDEPIQNIAGKTDIIVVERNLFGDVLTSIQYYKVRNKSIIAIFDDAYDKILPENAAYSFWKNGEVKYVDENEKENIGIMTPNPLTQFKWGTRMVKGIQVPSQALAEDWSIYNKTYHIPNYIDFSRYENVKPLFPHTDKDIIIGWGGSLSHVDSFKSSGVIPALKNITKKYKNVKVMITGDKRVFDLLEDIPNNKKIYNNFVPEEQFSSLMKTFDIALAPLVGEYDYRRSRIKVLEYMALKIPWVASDYPPYKEFSEYGYYSNNTQESWEENISKIIDNIEERKSFASGAPYEYSKTQTYENNIEKTISLYEKIIEDEYLS